MSTYRIALGYNQLDVDMAKIKPQPRSTGIQPVDRTFAISGEVYEYGDYVRLSFDFLDGETEYQALLVQFGLDSALTSQVTVYVRNWDFTWVKRNGLAVRPEVGKEITWQNFFPRNVDIIIKNLATTT